MSQVDSRTIAEFSGGNARIAIALARTVKPGESLSNLKDRDLFERLFYQNNEKPDKDLLKAAEVCSLVYSFECKIDDEEEDLELQLLGSLADMTVKQLYRHISELERRELIQQRGVWRAVLPGAIANRLATRALADIRPSKICEAFEQKGSERILQSFSRRLSYLHESDEARKVAKRWLSDDGLLADISNLNPLGINLFKNITPIEPEAAITAIEKAAKSDSSGKFLSIENPNHDEFRKLLRSLAYDEKLFSRSVNLLCQFALSANLPGNRNPLDPSDPLTSLFHLYLYWCHLLRLISSKPDGEIVAIKIFSMRLHRNSDEEPNVSSIIATLGQELVLNHQFSPRTREVRHDLGDITESCFMNDSAAKKLCEKLVRFLTNCHEISEAHLAIPQLEALASTQPSIFLDGFLGDEIDQRIFLRLAGNLPSFNPLSKNPLSKIDDEIIIKWCEEKNRGDRYLRVAVIEPYQYYDQDNRLEWTPLAKKIIDSSPDPIPILNLFKSAFMSMSGWEGEVLAEHKKQLRLITELKNHENCSVAEWAKSEEVNFKDAIASEIKRESAIDERFE